MNGIKHLILGNHDEGKPFTYERFGFTTVHTALIYNDDVILRHDPATANVMPDKLWLVGHVHNVFRLTTEPVRCYNVGVDVNDFYPVTLDYIYSELDSAIKAKEHTIKVQE
jgi:calcineurin-like phosphoesterase family protein